MVYEYIVFNIREMCQIYTYYEMERVKIDLRNFILVGLCNRIWILIFFSGWIKFILFFEKDYNILFQLKNRFDLYVKTLGLQDTSDIFVM